MIINRLSTSHFTLGKEYKITDQKDRLIEIKDDMGHYRYVIVENNKAKFVIGQGPAFAYFDIV